MKKAIIGTIFVLSSMSVVGKTNRQLNNDIINMRNNIRTVLQHLNKKIEDVDCSCSNKSLIGKVVNINFIKDDKSIKNNFKLVTIIDYGKDYIQFKDSEGKTVYYNGVYKIYFTK